MKNLIRIIFFLLISIGILLIISQSFLMYSLYTNQFSFENYPILYISFLIITTFVLGFGIRTTKNVPFFWAITAFSSYQLYLYLKSLIILFQHNNSINEINLIQYSTLFFFITLYAIIFVCSVFVIHKKQFRKKS